MASPKGNSEFVRNRNQQVSDADDDVTSSEPPMPILEVQDGSSMSPTPSPPHLSPQTDDAEFQRSPSTSTEYHYQCPPMRKAAGWALLGMKGVAWKSSSLRAYQDRAMLDSDESLDDPFDDKTDRDFKPRGSFTSQFTPRFGYRVGKPKGRKVNRGTGRRGGRTGLRSSVSVSVPARLTRRNARRRLVKRKL